jgi:hypothetical protein
MESNMRINFIVLICLSILWLTVHAAEMETIRLQHRLPDEVAMLVKPLLQPDERIVPSPNGLIVLAEPSRINEIRRLVDQLDRRSVQFVVSVVQSDSLSVEQLNAQIGFEAQLPLNNPRDWRGRVDGVFNHSQTDRSIDTHQTLNVLEGHPAYIEVGEEQPVSIVESDGYYSYTRRLDYRKATTGFQLLPHMLGDCRVRLQISPWSVHATTGRAGNYSVQSAETTLEVALGKWFELGTHHQDEEQRQNQLLGYGSRQRQQQSNVFLKIDTPRGCHTTSRK